MNSEPYTGSQIGKAETCGCGGNCACGTPKPIVHSDKTCASDCSCQTNPRYRVFADMDEEDMQELEDYLKRRKAERRA